MKGSAAKPRSQRQLRVGEVIRHALVRLIERGEANDPQLNEISITITQVLVSPDLRASSVFIMPLGGENAAKVLESLNRAAPFFKRRLASIVKLRKFPTISFKLDNSFDNADKIEFLLKTPAVVADIRASAEVTED